MPNESSNIKERIKSDIKEPGKYNVVFHNDDFTPMDFVINILELIFFKTPEDAVVLMLKVHNQGKAVVGSYTYDIAMSKAMEATELARKNEYPLRISVNLA